MSVGRLFVLLCTKITPLQKARHFFNAGFRLYSRKGEVGGEGNAIFIKDMYPGKIYPQNQIYCVAEGGRVQCY